jgi:hypothetical protein
VLEWYTVKKPSSADIWKEHSEFRVLNKSDRDNYYPQSMVLGIYSIFSLLGVSCYICHPCKEGDFIVSPILQKGKLVFPVYTQFWLRSIVFFPQPSQVSWSGELLTNGHICEKEAPLFYFLGRYILGSEHWGLCLYVAEEGTGRTGDWGWYCTCHVWCSIDVAVAPISLRLNLWELLTGSRSCGKR